MTKQIDYPILEIEETAKTILAKGGYFFQKWTCGGCGKRITGNTRNGLFINGHCEECNHVTDLIVTGCNCVAFVPL